MVLACHCPQFCGCAGVGCDICLSKRITPAPAGRFSTRRLSRIITYQVLFLERACANAQVRAGQLRAQAMARRLAIKIDHRRPCWRTGPLDKGGHLRGTQRLSIKIAHLFGRQRPGNACRADVGAIKNSHLCARVACRVARWLECVQFHRRRTRSTARARELPAWRVLSERCTDVGRLTGPALSKWALTDPESALCCHFDEVARTGPGNLPVDGALGASRDAALRTP